MFFSQAPHLTIFCKIWHQNNIYSFAMLNWLLYLSVLFNFYCPLADNNYRFLVTCFLRALLALGDLIEEWYITLVRPIISKPFGPLHPLVVWTAFECLDLKNFPQKLHGIEIPSKWSTSMWSLTWLCFPFFPQALQVYTGVPALLFSKLFVIIELTCSSSFCI